MRCGPLLDVFPTGQPGGFRLVGHLGGLAAEPLLALLEPVASCGLSFFIRLLASSGGSAVLVTNARPAVLAFLDRILPDGKPGLLVLPAPRVRAGAQSAAS